MNTPHRCTIVPPYLLRRLVASPDPAVSASAALTLRHDGRFRTRREEPPKPRPTARAATVAVQRRLYDAKSTQRLPGTLVRAEGDPASDDQSVNEAWEGFGATWALFWEAFGRNSIDGAGLLLAGTVHYGQFYDNAFWDGVRMVFGDGDGDIFGRFTASLDVIGHELTHGLTQYTANLDYSGQSGALNEHVSDVFGVLVKQRHLGQDAAAADWLIGADVLLPGVKGVALRNMLHPGTAYDDPRLGKDPQPDHMDRYVQTGDDYGGVHINSGIPNRAFALAATRLGGHAWEGVGRVWFDTLTGALINPTTGFAAFAGLTIAAARARFGATGPQVEEAVAQAWADVGVSPTEPPQPAAGEAGSAGLPPSSGGAPTAGAPVPTGEAPSAGAPPSAPSADLKGAEADLLLRRTGGIAGIVQERQTTLAELPRGDAQRWNRLLQSDSLQRRADKDSQVRDGFCYTVASDCHDVRVTVAEEHLTDPQRSLFHRTLDEEQG